MLAFTERMAQSREVAQVARNRGQHTGQVVPGWNARRLAMTGLDGLESYYQQFRADIQYNAFLAVERELFGDEWEGIEI